MKYRISLLKEKNIGNDMYRKPDTIRTSIEIEKHNIVKAHLARRGVSLREYVNQLISNDIRDYGNEKTVIDYFKK